MNHLIALENSFGAHNYKPLPVVLVRGEGVFLWDDAGKKYLDMMSAYSAVSHGHCHPRLVEALVSQVKQLAIVRPLKFPSQAMISALFSGTPLTVYAHFLAAFIAVSTASAPVFMGSAASCPVNSQARWRKAPNLSE